MAGTVALLIALWLPAAADDVWTQFDTAVERVFHLKTKLVGARAAVTLASSACRVDRERARTVFIRAMEHLKAADPSGGGDGLPVRGYLLRACRQCDPLLARQLAAMPGASVFDTFEDELRRASADASSDPEHAAANVLRAASVLPWVPDEQRTRFARVLLKLRAGNSDIADSAFLEILENLLDEPSEAVPSLFALGNYVLGPRRIDAETVRPEILEGGGTAYVFRAERPSVSEELLIVYLESAVTTLATVPAPNESAIEELQREMLERLRPFVAKWTAHMSPDFNHAARRLKADELETAEDTPAPTGSVSTLTLFQREWTRGDGAGMRGLLAGLPRNTPHGPYEVLANFSEAMHALGAGNTELAAAIASKMPEGIQKTLVHAGLPGRDHAFLFYREASRADRAVRPGLLLVAAQRLKRYAPDPAQAALLEAVEALNQLDRGPRPSSDVRWLNSGFVQFLGPAHFRLAVPSMPLPDLRAAVTELAPRDPGGVLTLISEIQSERRRATALVAWAEALLAGGVD